jgi:hypothetical protein
MVAAESLAVGRVAAGRVAAAVGAVAAVEVLVASLSLLHISVGADFFPFCSPGGQDPSALVGAAEARLRITKEVGSHL